MLLIFSDALVRVPANLVPEVQQRLLAASMPSRQQASDLHTSVSH
jgi:hypothetical protein